MLNLTIYNLIVQSYNINNQMPKRGKQHSNSRSQSSHRKNTVSRHQGPPKKHTKPKHNAKQQKTDTFAKTKPIHKEMPKVKGKQLFQIVAEDDEDEDQFAALGKNSSEGEQQQEFQQQDYGVEEQQGSNDQKQIEDDEEFGGQIEQEEEEDEEYEEEKQAMEEEQQKVEEKVQQEQQDMPMAQQQQQEQQQVDISVINLQIQETISILMNVAKLGGGLPRKHFIEKLKNLIHKYYGYNFDLIDHFLTMFNPSEMVQFFQANETQRPLTIRTNTLKTRRKQLAQALIQRGVNLDPLAEWSQVGIKIYDTKVPIGATPEYLAGHYMLQSASSLLPVIALDPQIGQKILDMAAAPGGKTTYIAQLMKNTGCIFANDLKKERLRALQFNLYRMGITNTAITCRDGRKYPKLYPGTFDRVLLDAPCTGLGIISKDHSIKANRVLVDIYKNAHVQRQLLLAAIDCTKVGGTIVYSTCSVSPLENEGVVNYALKKRFIKLVDCGLEVGQQGMIKFGQKRFNLDLKKTRRIYPHVHNMDGFYVAKIMKTNKGVKQTTEEQNEQ